MWVTPCSRSTRLVATFSPLAKSRTVAGCATDERMSAATSIVSPRFAVDGVTTRSTSTSSPAPTPIVRVSIRMSRVAARAASAWPPPVVSLPSDRRTMRFWASSGNSAVASRSAAPTSVAVVTGVEASREISATSDGNRSTSACFPNATMPATSPLGMSVSDSRMKASASSRPAFPTESDMSTTKTVASRSTGRTIRNPARASTSAVSSTVRRTREIRRRPAPTRRRALRYSPIVIASSGISRSSASGVSKLTPIRLSPWRPAV